MPGPRWLVPIAAAAVGAALLARRLRRESLERVGANVRAFDLPSAGLYDALVTPIFGPLYARIARELATRLTSGQVLEIGGGPGRLAIALARLTPELSIVVVDVSPDMVALANRRAAEAGLAARVRAVSGDAAALPYPDGHFDGAFSNFSVHHWSDPAAGMAELHRVLKPGAEAWIYDIPPWLRRSFHAGPELGALAAASPFGGGEVEVVAWAGLPISTRLRLRRAEGG